MPRRPKRSIPASLFVRGLGTLLPVVLTVFVFVTIFQFANGYVTRPINTAIYWCLEGNTLGWRALDRLGIDPYAEEFLEPSDLPLELQTLGAQKGYVRSRNFTNQLELLRAERAGFFRDLEDLCIDERKLREAVQAKVHPFFGVALSLLVILLAGWTLSGFAGRGLMAVVERILGAIPIVRSVYPCSKQLVEFFLSEKEIEFESVAAIPYPRRGLWSLGFVTNAAPRSVTDHAGQPLVCVFVPSSPMPMTGYTILVPADEIVPLSISVDEALRITVSGGVLIPPAEQDHRRETDAGPPVEPPEDPKDLPDAA